MTTEQTMYHVEGWNRTTQSWVRLHNREFDSLKEAMTNASDSAYNDSARYRVVKVETTLVQEFKAGPISVHLDDLDDDEPRGGILTPRSCDITPTPRVEIPVRRMRFTGFRVEDRRQPRSH